ncbi:MAG TPA: hypothetical protein VF212_02745 [Longimicrobiales bacterium]
MRRSIATAVSLFGLLALAAPARAQDGAPADALQEGRRSLTFSVPSGGGASFGFWTMRSPRTNLGIDVNLSLRRNEDSDEDALTDWGITAGPAIKRYFPWTSGPVAPFFYGGVNLSWRSNDLGGGGTVERTLGLGLSGGVGVEWFPTRQISIGGYTGLHAGYSRETQENEALDLEASRSAFNLNTFRSSLTLHIYFGGPDVTRRPDVAVERP